MKELSLEELEKMSKSGQEFAAPPTQGSARQGFGQGEAFGAGIASTADRSPLGFWVLGAALRALWLKV